VGRMKNTASISGALILRAFSRSNDVYRAMLSRGWKQGSQYHIEFAPLKRYDILIGIVFFSTVTGLVFLDRFL
jgi:energy-coupling factor transporter transmembrane protein EcfT